MMRGPGLAAWPLAAMLGLAVAACSSGTKLSSKQLCENSGGKYAQGTCQPGSAKRAQDMCLGYGGIYLADEDLCHIQK